MSVADLKAPAPFEWEAFAARSEVEIRHSVAFYEDDQALVGSISRFIGSALGAGNSAVVIATAPHREELEVQLRRCGFDVDALTARDQLVLLDARGVLAMFCDGTSIDQTRYTEVIGRVLDRAQEASDGRLVSAFGEMVSLLVEDGRADLAANLEACWNELAKTHSFSLHCAYPMKLFRDRAGSAAIRAACDAHDWVVPTEGFTALNSERDRLLEVARLQQQAAELEGALRDREAAIQRAEEAIRNREKFLAMAAHELRTPVTVLKGGADLLDLKFSRGDVETGEVERALPLLTQGADRLAELCDELLVCVTTGEFNADDRAQPVDLSAILTEAVEQATARSSAAYLFEVDIAPGSTIRGDHHQLLVAVGNVLDNATKFSAPGSVLRVALAEREMETVVTVEDQGIGLTEEDCAVIFQPFYRGHNAIQGRYPGRGIGLYVTRRIVESHGGTVTISPRGSGRGSVVSLTFPRS